MSHRRTAWHVRPWPDNTKQYKGWQVKRQGAEKAAKVFRLADGQTVRDAIDRAKEIAANNAPARIILHKTPEQGENGNVIQPIRRGHSY